MQRFWTQNSNSNKHLNQRRMCVDFHQKMIYLLETKNNEKREKLTAESVLSNIDL